MALSSDGSKLVVAGGMTSSCSSDAVIHSLDISGSTWTSASPSGFTRRHGAAATVVSSSSSEGEMMLVGGLADKYVCSSGSSAYSASDLIDLPASSTAATTLSLPSGLTGTDLAISDFALANSNGTVYLVGGQDADGDLVSPGTIGVWTSSGGWKSQKVTGDVPSGRLGATLVAHPWRNVLVMYGGSVQNSTASSDFSASNLVAVLDTSSWKWSTPSNMQPGSSAAVSYHTSVITPSGVMVTAFGRSSTGSPTTNQQYLDMRDASSTNWAWTSTWSSDMLTQYTVTSASDHTSKSHKSTVTAAVVPTVIGLLIIIPLLVWFFRRHQRNSRKRRLASHFSFSTQEDNGDFTRVDGRGRGRGALYPFGRDANEKESSQGSYVSSMRNAIFTVFRRSSPTHGVGDDGTIHEQQMAQVSPAELQEKGMNWEEIDFGLGRVDAERRDANYTDLPPRVYQPRRATQPRDSFQAPGSPNPEIPFPMAMGMPIASTIYPVEMPPQEPVTGELVNVSDSPRLGSPRYDGQASLVTESRVAEAGAEAAGVEDNDWNMLEQSLNSRPAFRSLSPSATLRSHNHTVSPSTTYHSVAPASPVHSNSSHASVESAPPGPAPSLPPLAFSNSPMIKSNTGNRITSTGSARHLAGTSRRVSSGNMRRVSGPPTDMAPGPSNRRSSQNALGISTSGTARSSNGMSRLRVVNTDDENPFADPKA